MRGWLCLALALVGCSEGRHRLLPPEPSNLASRSEGLAPGPERRMVIDYCTPCHSAKLIQEQHLSREEWDETISWMQAEENLWVLPTKVRGRILDYLVRHHGPAEGVAALDDRPWAGSRYRPNPLW